VQVPGLSGVIKGCLYVRLVYKVRGSMMDGIFDIQKTLLLKLSKGLVKCFKGILADVSPDSLYAKILSRPQDGCGLNLIINS